MTAEIGRQPWIVYGVMRTDTGVSLNVSAVDLGISLVLFAAAYVVISWLWLTLVRREVRRGPVEA
jgi:cytochrome d ubiquinol oxidase subunit I